MELGGTLQNEPPTLAEARSEFGGPLPQLVDQSSLELAAVGVSRRSGVLTGATLSYFDLRTTIAAPEKPEVAVPKWLSEWIDRLTHPLLEGVVQVWSRDEFMGSRPSADLLIRAHAASTVEPRPIAQAMIIDGEIIEGFSADDDERICRAVVFGDVWVLVSIPSALWPGTPQLTTR
jgi:hypothetical protein